MFLRSRLIFAAYGLLFICERSRQQGAVSLPGWKDDLNKTEIVPVNKSGLGDSRHGSDGADIEFHWLADLPVHPPHPNERHRRSSSVLLDMTKRLLWGKGHQNRKKNSDNTDNTTPLVTETDATEDAGQTTEDVTDPTEQVTIQTDIAEETTSILTDAMEETTPMPTTEPTEITTEITTEVTILETEEITVEATEAPEPTTEAPEPTTEAPEPTTEIADEITAEITTEIIPVYTTEVTILETEEITVEATEPPEPTTEAPEQTTEIADEETIEPTAVPLGIESTLVPSVIESTTQMEMIDMVESDLAEPAVTPSGVSKGKTKGKGKGRGKTRTFAAPGVDKKAARMKNGRLQFGPMAVPSKPTPHTGDKEKKIQKQQQRMVKEKLLNELRAQNPNVEYPPMPPDEGTEAMKRDLSLDIDEVMMDGEQEEIREWEVMLNRRKRTIMKDTKFRWLNGVMPYKFETSNTDEQMAEYQQSMSRYEFHTCVRFVEHNDTTQVNYGLNHNNYLNFLSDGTGCWSYVGNVFWWSGQSMSCCGKWACIHELGHALGLKHEQISPMRDDWIRVRWENLSPTESKMFQKVSTSDFIQERYDLTTDMHYTFGTSMLTLDPRQAYLLTVNEDFYYMFKSVSEAHNCQASACSDHSSEICYNDGYYSSYDGRCQCICPTGLDPASNCQQPLAQPDQTLKTKQWPGGSYALFKPNTGCPSSDWVTMTTGSSTHKSSADIVLSPHFSLAGAVAGATITLEYCVKNTESSGEPVWPRGMYCILKTGSSCPSGFMFGNAEMIDKNPPSSSGSLPNFYFSTKTVMRFCCREDGADEDPIAMPTQTSFILFQKGTAGCQNVRDMTTSLQYFTFTNKANSVTISYGSLPQISQNVDLVTIYFCYYEPITYGCGSTHELSPGSPTVSIQSPNYPANYSNQQMCTWLIKSPANTKVKISFDDFDVEQPSDGNGCWDTVEIRDNYLGQGGHRYCGEGFASSILTNFNTLMVILRTNYEVTKRGFRATVQLVSAENYCYNLADEGTSYRGNVNYTVDFDVCLPWAKMVHCRHHSFHPDDLHDGLDGNFCRNPGDGSRPWCYIASDGCVRNYCDVCQIERCFDFDDTCVADSANDTIFCKTTRAFRFCQKTCNLCDEVAKNITTVSEISCSTPVIPSDSELVGASSLLSSYAVGDQVSYRCKNDVNTIQTSVCLSDRKWSTKGYTCGGCSTGWTYMNGFCYKFFEEHVLYPDAESRCSGYGAYVSPAKDEVEMNFLNVLRGNSPNLWLGATDKVTQGQWVWADGSAFNYSNWANGQPNNFNNMEDCVYMAEFWNNNMWSDVYCNFYNYYTFVCKKPLNAHRILCADQVDTCDDIINLNPDACSVYHSFANQVCPCSCLKCGWAPTCNATLPFGNLTMKSETTVVQTGYHVEYQCFDNYVHTGGDLKRACMKCGQLTGEMPYCIELQQSVWPNNQVSIQRRTLDSWPLWAYTADNDNMKIQRRGKVVAWHFYSGNEGKVVFQILKVLARQPDRTMLVEIVGATSLYVKYDREYYHELLVTERIPVEAGYLISMNFDVEAGVLQYDACNAVNQPEAQDWKYGFFFDPMNPGETWLFNHFSPCRLYSVKAIIGPA